MAVRIMYYNIPRIKNIVLVSVLLLEISVERGGLCVRLTLQHSPMLPVQNSAEVLFNISCYLSTLKEKLLVESF